MTWRYLSSSSDLSTFISGNETKTKTFSHQCELITPARMLRISNVILRLSSHLLFLFIKCSVHCQRGLIASIKNLISFHVELWKITHTSQMTEDTESHLYKKY